MQKHTKIYLDYFGHSGFEYIACEKCKFNQIQDIHHIQHGAKGRKNNIENLMGLCRTCHDKAHNEEYKRDELQIIHNEHLKLWNK